MPSMVRISAPLACTANIVQDLTDLPLRSTVQAPQWLVSQPICGPVILSSSRRKWMSKVRGSTRASTVLPLIFITTWDFAIGLPLKSFLQHDLFRKPDSAFRDHALAAGARFGAGERAGEHHARHFGAVAGGPAGILGRRGNRLGRGDRAFDSREIGRAH